MGNQSAHAARVSGKFLQHFLGILLAIALFRLLSVTSSYRDVIRAADALANERDSVIDELRTTRPEISYLRRLASAGRIRASFSVIGADRDGNQLTLELTNLRRPVLFYTLDVRCPSCISSIPFLNTLARSQRCDVDVVAILLNDKRIVDEWQRTHRDVEFAFTMMDRPSDDVWEFVPPDITPSAVLVGLGGEISGWWLGALDYTDEAAIMRQLEDHC